MKKVYGTNNIFKQFFFNLENYGKIIDSQYVNCIKKMSLSMTL